MSCRRAERLMGLVLDGEATEDQERLLRFHLNGCSSCARVFRMLSDISAVASDLPEPVPPPDLELRVRRRLVAAEAAAGAAPRRRRLLPAMAAAALLMLAVVSVQQHLGGDPMPAADATAATVQTRAKAERHMASAKSRVVRPAELSTFSRQASLISF